MRDFTSIGSRGASDSERLEAIGRTLFCIFIWKARLVANQGGAAMRMCSTMCPSSRPAHALAKAIFYVTVSVRLLETINTIQRVHVIDLSSVCVLCTGVGVVTLWRCLIIPYWWSRGARKKVCAPPFERESKRASWCTKREVCLWPERGESESRSSGLSADLS